MTEAGYLNLAPKLKLALMHMAAYADDDTRLARPPIVGTAMWADCHVDEAWVLRAGLEARGLIRVLEPGEDALYEVMVPCDCPDGEGWLK